MGYSRIKLAGPKMTYYVTFSTYYVTCKITDEEILETDGRVPLSLLMVEW